VSAMKCPLCGLLNPETATRCDCGYDFSSMVLVSSPGQLNNTLLSLSKQASTIIGLLSVICIFLFVIILKLD
jgi:uncharacterized membrane protein YvbJ